MMDSPQYVQPILFLIFNRPKKTKQVFEAIRAQKPRQIFIAADGPRSNVESDKASCDQTRSIIDEIDWDCSLQTLFRSENLGCKLAVSSAIDWFFNNVEMGIILEDDCLPNDSFFPFLDELLQKYRGRSQIMMISGSRLMPQNQELEHGYEFTSHPIIWGWATWRRAWSLYDVNMSDLPSFLQQQSLDRISDDQDIRNYWINCLIKTYLGEINTWDYPWMFSHLLHDGLGICPNKNLVKNIGFDQDATHGDSPVMAKATSDTHSLTIQSHPEQIAPNQNMDYESYLRFYNVKINSIQNPVLRLMKLIKKRRKTRKRLKQFLSKKS
jgi:hypothetical protein